MNFSLWQWKMDSRKHKIYVLDRDAQESGSTNWNAYNIVVIELTMTRNWHHYFVTVLLPLIIIVCSAFLTLFFDDRNEGIVAKPHEVLSYLGSLLLSLIAVRWSFSEKMPKIPYLCCLDYCFILSYSAIFMLMASCVQRVELGGVILFALFALFRLKVFYDKTKYSR